MKCIAGAASIYGSSADGVTYWASLAQYTGVRTYRNNFSSMVVCDDPEDMTRFICLGRLRGEETFDHGSYVSMRESRHVCGIKTLDLRDLCLGQTHEDALYTCYSNYDPKGKTDADMIYCGFLPPQARIQIPLGALMPVDKSGRHIKGIYVAGKAISATHNIFPSIRMQPDLMHQGAVLGLLAGWSAGKNVLIEELETDVRRRLIAEETGDMLEAPFRTRPTTNPVNVITKETKTHSVDLAFTQTEKERNPLLEVVCKKSDEMIPLIQDRIAILSDAEDQNELVFMLKKLALWHGGREYVKDICQDLRFRLQHTPKGLPRREGSVMCAQLLPDHGVMPEFVYDLNLLANAREIPVDLFEEVAKRLEDMDRDYFDIRQGIYPYMESFAYVAEHTGCKEMIPAIRKLIEFPEFSNILPPERQSDLMSERLQLLYLSLCRALHSLGDSKGREGMRMLNEAPGLAIRKAAKIDIKRRDRLW